MLSNVSREPSSVRNGSGRSPTAEKSTRALSPSTATPAEKEREITRRTTPFHRDPRYALGRKCIAWSSSVALASRLGAGLGATAASGRSRSAGACRAKRASSSLGDGAAVRSAFGVATGVLVRVATGVDGAGAAISPLFAGSQLWHLFAPRPGSPAPRSANFHHQVCGPAHARRDDDCLDGHAWHCGCGGDGAQRDAVER